MKDLVDIIESENYLCPDCGEYDNAGYVMYDDPDDAPRGVGLMHCPLCGRYIDGYG